MNYEDKFGTTDKQNTKDDMFNKIFVESVDPQLDDEDESLKIPSLVIDLDEVNEKTLTRATIIAEKLSAYYFDPKYVEKHPYIENKISQEIDNIRRLLKMLSINEKAQDTLITSITLNSGKGSLYGSLTSLQNSMLSMQSQLNQLTSNLENVFREMQENCEQTFEAKDKEEGPDGGFITRGSREFIEEIMNRINRKKQENNQEDVQEVV